MNEWHVRPLCAAPMVGVHMRVACRVGAAMSNFVHAGEQPTYGFTGVERCAGFAVADGMALGRVVSSIV